jgi:hypothetical protein
MSNFKALFDSMRRVLQETATSGRLQSGSIVQSISDHLDVLQEETKQLEQAVKATQAAPCAHPSIFCEEGNSRLDEDEEFDGDGDYQCSDCGQWVHMENVIRCVDACHSHSCANFKELCGEYASTSEDDEGTSTKETQAPAPKRRKHC